MSTATKTIAPPVKELSRSRQLLLPIAFIGCGLVIAVLFGYLQATVVTGSEFDTGTWTVREFWYRRDPFSQRQLTGILREPATSLISTKTNFPNSYFGKTVSSVSTPARWDLVELRSGATVSEGPAHVLVTYFESYVADRLWDTWSTNHLPKAAALWPAAKALVDLGLYHELPRIMEQVNIESTDAEFKTMIDEQMLRILQGHCDQLQIAGKTAELAIAKAVLGDYSASGAVAPVNSTK